MGDQQRARIENIVVVDAIFTSKESAATLLQPQVENNTLTEGDFHKAVNFLPNIKAARAQNVRIATASRRRALDSNF